MKEQWIDAFRWEEHYQVSNLGRVRSKPRKYWKPDPNHKTGGCWQFRQSRLLKTPINGDGYPQTRLSKNGKCFTRKIHKLVYESFKGEVPDGWHVDHIDGSRDNNKLGNLQAISPQNHSIETLERAHGIKMRREYLKYGRGMAMTLSQVYEDGFQAGYKQATKDLGKSPKNI